MRSVRTITVGVIAALCAAALGAAPALASTPVQHHFLANASKKGVARTFTETEPGELLGASEGPQEFDFSPFAIVCDSATSKGAITSNDSDTIFETVKYSECTTNSVKIGNKTVEGVRVKFGPVQYEYNANGFLETGSESESTVRLVNPGSVLIKIKELGKCLIEWEAQTLPEKAEEKPGKVYGDAVFTPFTVSNPNLKYFPTEEQSKLKIDNTFKDLEYEYEGGLCEKLETTGGEKGKAHGVLTTEVKDGNISWE
ncbi:MAG TPA: hypothetical protein VMD79_03275 [Solirubrobacteraceae bacterium]|nr:hypothetical protein [Solirubrobacteraceae bacterium]